MTLRFCSSVSYVAPTDLVTLTYFHLEPTKSYEVVPGARKSRSVKLIQKDRASMFTTSIIDLTTQHDEYEE